MAPLGGPPERDDLGYLLARAAQRWNNVLQQRCRAHGFPEVRPAFGSVLLPLFERDGLRMGELADWARLSKQNLTTLVREVERSGLVVRRPDEADGRAHRVWLTPRAEQFRPAALRIMEDMAALVGQELSARTLSILKRSLVAIVSLPATEEGQAASAGRRRT